MAYVLGLVLLLCPLIPCYGFCFVFGGMCPLSWYDAGDFGPDLVMVGIFVVMWWQFVEPCWCIGFVTVCVGTMFQYMFVDDCVCTLS